jgi:hypothetical protein
VPRRCRKRDRAETISTTPRIRALSVLLGAAPTTPRMTSTSIRMIWHPVPGQTSTSYVESLWRVYG